MASLPVEDEPLVLADGTKIDPSSGKVIKDKPKLVSVPSPSEAQRIVARTRKSVAELPLPPAQLSAVALVAFYTLFGLHDNDIAIALDSKLTVEQIENVRKLDAYIEFMASAKENIVNTQQDTVRELFQQHAHTAATNIISMAQEEGALGFAAARDVLDRAGHRPADVVEHRHKMEDSLNIVITKRDETQSIPTVDTTLIDVTPKEVDNG